MLAMQMVAPNSPQWFNTGLHWAYGIDGPGQGHYYVDFKTGKLTKSKSSYEHPQPHACFIQGVSDDLVNEGGIMDLWVREARLFKYGSGTGSNFSSLRGEGERLSGGGRSSGLMSFLKIGDRAAGAIKSGGTTRRAAKMVVVDVDHPDIETYIDWKVKEEQKVAALVTGSKINQKHLKAVMKACVNCEGAGDDCFDPEKNPALRREIKLARRALVPDNYIKRVIQFAKQGYKDIQFDIYDTDWDSEAYLTVSGQNSNNSVSLKDDFLRAVETDGDWKLIGRTTRKVTKTLKARDLWEKIGYAAWASADPGLHFNTTMNDWHTCKASGDIRASNPCSEYMFLDDTACNLASANLLTFYTLRQDGGVSTSTPMSISAGSGPWCSKSRVLMAQFPSKAIAELSYEFRTLGLGFANIGGLLMTMGLPYDSKEGRALCGALTAIMTGIAYKTSAEMAGELGTFPGYKKNAAAHAARDPQPPPRRPWQVAGLRGAGRQPGAARPRLLPASRPRRPCASSPGTMRSRSASSNGYRNAPVTVVAPTGTIGLVMDCDTTGIEPDFALVKFKKLAGGGYFKIINRAVPAGPARARLSRKRDRGDRGLCRRPRLALQRARHQRLDAEDQGLHRRSHRQGRKGAADRLRHQVRLQQVDLWRGFHPRPARHRRRGHGRAELRPARRGRLHQARDRGRQRAHLRRDDGRGRAASEGRALSGVRLRQSLRQDRQALSLGRKPHPHDGGVAAVHLRRDLEDHQHAERRHGGGLQVRLSVVLEARTEGQRALPRRLEAVASRSTRSSSPTMRTRTMRSRRSTRSRWPRARPRSRKRSSRSWSSASS